MKNHRLPLLVAALTSGLSTLHGQPGQGNAVQHPDGPRFRDSIELVNVTATVSDASGRYVPGLTRDDFIVYEDDVRQTVTHFSASRVPVSLGVALDTSGSMAGEKIAAAKSALDRFLYDLLDPDDEIFLYLFSDRPVLLQAWTTDRLSLSRTIGRIGPSGGTAMFDAVAEAIPLASDGHRQKKALLIISDGNDTSSYRGIREVKQRIRESEVIVYAVGIDGDDVVAMPPRGPIRRPQPGRPGQFPPPFPGGPGRRPGGWLPQWQQPQILGPTGTNGGWSRSRQDSDRVNVSALREMTDESGGRTEVIHDPRDLNPATASIADELSKQYELGYPSGGKRDGRWHSIRVELRNGAYRVRARNGYTAN